MNRRKRGEEVAMPPGQWECGGFRVSANYFNPLVSESYFRFGTFLEVEFVGRLRWHCIALTLVPNAASIG
jgi:hypothetical protein